MQARRTVALCFWIVACSDGAGDSDSSSNASGGQGGASNGGNSSSSSASSGGGAATAAGGAAAGGEGGEGGAPPPPPCDFEVPLAPPSAVLWATELAASGRDTLGGHGHDDQHGPVGFCQGVPVAGQPFYRLIAAGLEVDFDIQNDGSDADDYLAVDFYDDPATFTGLGESGGRVNVYIEVLDEAGNVLNVDSAPEILVDRFSQGGPTESFPLTSKPANEFQTNFPMVGGGARYGFGIQGASDRVINLRLPVNHHVCYVLVYQREMN